MSLARVLAIANRFGARLSGALRLFPPPRRESGIPASPAREGRGHGYGGLHGRAPKLVEVNTRDLSQPAPRRHRVGRPHFTRSAAT